jgi:mannose-6-phosphate isomerase-like protein (cupin superfamily)
MDAHISPVGAGETLPAGPATTSVRVPGDVSHGRLSVVEMRIESGWEGPPTHVHDVVDHLWYVLDGAVDLTLDGASAQYGRGSCVFVPTGVPHAFSTRGCGPVTLLQVDTPQALDGYFRDLRDAFPPGQPVDRAVVAQIMRRHDTRSLV